MTPEETAVVEAAKAWAAQIPVGSGLYELADDLVRALADAVRALTPPKPELPPEPANHEAVLIRYRSPANRPEVAQRLDLFGPDLDQPWFVAGVEGGYSWAELHNDNDLLSVDRLFPAADVAFLTDAARALLDALDAGHQPLPSTVHAVRTALASLAETTTPAEEASCARN